MARIRTIKPEFFTSEDIVALSAFARLLYIALWCEADKEGRMQWKPKTFKMRYFPADAIDVDALTKELIDAGLVKLYGDGLAYIPQFTKHQHINPRETASQLPEPVTRSPRVVHALPTRQDASGTVSDAQGGREGKGKEGDSAEPDGSAPTTGFAIPLNDGSEWAVPFSALTEWKSAFPAADVEQELREMRAWSLAKPANRKTSRGVSSFVVRWLQKAQDTPSRQRSGGDDSAWAGAK